MSQLEKQIVNVIRNYNLFSANDRLLLGVSGGPDSVALLSLVFNLNRTNNNCSELFIAHLNHLLRGEESEQDEQFVKYLSKRFKLPIIVERRDINEVARKQKLSLEEAARKERYKFLENAAQKVGANIIAVGHTADDNAETILHRIIRGAGILGLNGIRPKRKLTSFSTIDLVRPLLFSWRKDIIAYLKEMNLAYKIDSTNLEKDKFRSRIRVELIPLLEKNYNPCIKKSLVKLAEITTQNYDFLNSHTDSLFKKTSLNRQETDKVFKEVILDIPNLKKIPVILQQIIIRKAMVRLNIPLKKFGFKNYKNTLDLIKHKRKLISKDIKGYLNIRIDDNKLRLTNKKYHIEEKPVLEEVKLQVPGVTKLDEMKYKVKMEIREIKNGFLEELKRSKTKYVEAVDFNKINIPLTVRMRRQGDKFWPLGSGGTKKLKNFFIDNKIPRMERNTVPIVTMNGQPIWVVGWRIDNRVKITKETKKLLIMKVERC
ncbi:MAG: tRNA lysidine(34) synthetase TilS [Candidatus Scalinduaceae bacterium]